MKQYNITYKIFLNLIEKFKEGVIKIEIDIKENNVKYSFFHNNKHRTTCNPSISTIDDGLLLLKYFKEKKEIKK